MRSVFPHAHCNDKQQHSRPQLLHAYHSFQLFEEPLRVPPTKLDDCPRAKGSYRRKQDGSSLADGEEAKKRSSDSRKNKHEGARFQNLSFRYPVDCKRDYI